MKRASFFFVASLIAASCVGFISGQLISIPGVTNEAQAAASSRSDNSKDASVAPQPRLEPLIGIASLASDNYVRAIRVCGGIPVVLPDTDGSPEQIDEYMTLLDGLIMPGGPDIPPSEWGEEPHSTTNVLDEDRYRFEKALITAWINRTNKPLLGICLGSQWLNVAHGGSLIQDIPSEFGINHRHVTHMVKLDPDSRLTQIFGQTEFEVNSIHHQAVRKLGGGLRSVAHCPNGIIEAIETTDPERFLVGVQWHPEKVIPGDELQTKLIQAFIDASVEGSR